jgi:hypothetical protein
VTGTGLEKTVLVILKHGMCTYIHYHLMVAFKWLAKVKVYKNVTLGTVQNIDGIYIPLTIIQC